MDTQIALAAFFALASAVGFALSTSLQHREAGGSPSSGVIGVLRFVLTRRMWVLGALIGFVALIFHALALNKGAIALVQPIMVSGVVLAVLFRRALDRAWPPRRELIGVTLTTLALGTFLVVADPRAEADADDARALILWAFGAVCIGALVVFGNRLPNRTGASFVLGMASGVCFGLTAGLLKMISNDYGADGLAGVLTSWHLYAQIATGITGVAINQRAYHLAPLAISMPVLNVVDVLVALAFGLIVFDEVPTRDPFGVVLLGLCLVLMGLGLRMLASVQPEAPAASQESAASEMGST